VAGVLELDPGPTPGGRTCVRELPAGVGPTGIDGTLPIPPQQGRFDGVVGGIFAILVADTDELGGVCLCLLLEVAGPLADGPSEGGPVGGHVGAQDRRAVGPVADGGPGPVGADSIGADRAETLGRDLARAMAHRARDHGPGDDSLLVHGDIL
jgi:hypothetical protein